MHQSYPSRLASQPNAKRPRITHVTAVFSEDWNFTFNPRNVRSRRHRFLGGGEKISGFTAIFCDEWKDIVDDEEKIDEFMSCSKRGRDENEDEEVFAHFGESSQACWRRQRLDYLDESPLSPALSLESSFSPSADSPSSPFTATSPELQIYKLDRFESAKKSSSMHSNLTLSGGFSCRASTPDIPAFHSADRDLYLALVASEAVEECPTTATSWSTITKPPKNPLNSFEEGSNSSGCDIELGGFDFWDDFMKSCIGVPNYDSVKDLKRVDDLKEPKFEIGFEEMIDC